MRNLTRTIFYPRMLETDHTVRVYGSSSVWISCSWFLRLNLLGPWSSMLCITGHDNREKVT